MSGKDRDKDELVENETEETETTGGDVAICLKYSLTVSNKETGGVDENETSEREFEEWRDARDKFNDAYLPLTERLEACQSKARMVFGLDSALGEADKVAVPLRKLVAANDFDEATKGLPRLTSVVETLEKQVAASEKVRQGHDPLWPRVRLALQLKVIEGPAVAKARDEALKCDQAVMDAWTAGNFAEAEKGLEKIGPALDELDVAKRKALGSQIRTLSGWKEAKADTQRLGTALKNLTAPLIANLGFDAVQDDIQKTIADWRTVRSHNHLVAGLAKSHAAIARIPTNTPDPYATERTAYEDAQFKTPNPATTIANCDRLAGLRTALADAARNLMTAYEKVAPENDKYWKTKVDSLFSGSSVLTDRVTGVVPSTPAMGTLQQEYKSLMDFPVLVNLRDNKQFKTAALQIESAISKGNQLLAMRWQPQDPNETKFYGAYRKVEKTIAAAAKITDTVDPTKTAIEAFTPLHTSFTSKLASTDGDRFTWCSNKLAELATKANDVLNAKTEALRIELGEVGKKTTDGEKVTAALSLIQGADGDILSRLSGKEHCDLLEALRSQGMPDFDEDVPATKDDPKRVAMRKVYASMSLDQEFVTKDEESRAKLIEALKEKKEELKAARENWLSYSDKQKEDLLNSVAEAQAKAFGFPMPTGKVTLYNDPDDDDMGSYAPGDFSDDPPKDSIKLNAGKDAMLDFETSMDTILHEMTHKYQNHLVRRLRLGTGGKTGGADKLDPSEDPPYTQARMFDFGNVSGGYVSGNEDRPVYNKQPEEDHAWKAGPQSAYMLMQMLDAP